MLARLRTDHRPSPPSSPRPTISRLKEPLHLPQSLRNNSPSSMPSSRFSSQRMSKTSRKRSKRPGTVKVPRRLSLRRSRVSERRARASSPSLLRVVELVQRMVHFMVYANSAHTFIHVYTSRSDWLKHGQGNQTKTTNRILVVVDWVPGTSSLGPLIESIQSGHIAFIQFKVVYISIRPDPFGFDGFRQRDIAARQRAFRPSLSTESQVPIINKGDLETTREETYPFCRLQRIRTCAGSLPHLSQILTTTGSWNRLGSARTKGE